MTTGLNFTQANQVAGSTGYQGRFTLPLIVDGMPLSELGGF